jgi:exosome complex RNA-binding protein Rrp42 (RNase PH superfamily)
MMNPVTPEIFRQIEPLSYVSKFLENGVRPDGRTEICRSLVEVRKHGVIDSALGSASVRIGNTSVIASVNGGIFVTPQGIVHSSGNHGKLNVACDYSLCLLGDRRQAQVIASQISQPIETVLNNEAVFDVKNQLVVDLLEMADVTGKDDKPKPVWDLTVNILVVRDDGSVLDCALMAAVAAIANARLPFINPVTMLVEGIESRQLTISNIPLAFTFVYFKNEWLIDPTKEEENVLPRMNVIINGHQPSKLFGLYGPQPSAVPTAGSTPPDLGITDLPHKILPLIEKIRGDRISKLC